MCVQKRSKNKINSRKRTQYMCANELKQIRYMMRFEPRHMCLVLEYMPRRTYQDYEANKRGIPEALVKQIREVYRRDCEFMNGTCTRVDAAIIQQFPTGFIPSDIQSNYFDPV